MVKYFENLSNLLDLISDRISLEAFLDNSVIRFKDTFYTKRNVLLYKFRKKYTARSKLECQAPWLTYLKSNNSSVELNNFSWEVAQPEGSNSCKKLSKACILLRFKQ